MAPSVVYVLPATSLHGGNRVPFEHATGLMRRGYEVLVVSPEAQPDWLEVEVPYRRVPIFEPGAIPPADICIATFWVTVEPALASGARHVFHLCQGYEGVHREYAPVLDQIEAVYSHPIPKLLISRHLEPILRRRYEAIRIHFLGQSIDPSLFSPGPFREAPRPLRFGLVGPFGYRSKGISEALEGLGKARSQGVELEVWRASAYSLCDGERGLGLTDRFFHRLRTEQMVDFYHQLDVLVHPSHDEEGFPLPPLEAMACGVPVALTDIGSFAVFPDSAVRRFRPGDADSLVPVIEALVAPELRRSLRQAGLETISDYAIEPVLDRLEAAFAEEGALVVAGGAVSPSPDRDLVCRRSGC